MRRDITTARNRGTISPRVLVAPLFLVQAINTTLEPLPALREPDTRGLSRGLTYRCCFRLSPRRPSPLASRCSPAWGWARPAARGRPLEPQPGPGGSARGSAGCPGPGASRCRSGASRSCSRTRTAPSGGHGGRAPSAAGPRACGEPGLGAVGVAGD